ncbi:MAG TPA: ATP-grasp domain-containing protein [Acidimicrobiia bacterium]|nr:ATP-grasp domain-containing protein [Acidimicrobiia bacterium]
MPTAVVLLPSTTYRASDFLRAAEGLGVDLVVASENPPPFDMGDRYLQVDCSDPTMAAEAIVALGDQVAIDGVVAADDAGVVAAAIAGQKLGVRANDPDAAAATRDKGMQRSLLARAEVPQPEFAVVPASNDGREAAALVGYPLVLKPLDRSAGQGVIRVDRPEELGQAVARVRSIVGETSTLVVEEFMTGDEIALEGLVREGELTTLAIFDKPGATEGPYFPETILVTPTRLTESSQAECSRVAAASLSAMGISHGPVHVEMKVDGDRARVIEVAARSIGGLCSRSLNFGLLGTTLETLILRNAIGLEKPELRREQTASGVLMVPIPRPGRFISVEGLDRVRSLEHISAIDITTTPGSRVDPPPEGDRYLGFVFARGPERAGVEGALRQAMGILKVVIE